MLAAGLASGGQAVSRTPLGVSRAQPPGVDLSAMEARVLAGVYELDDGQKEVSSPDLQGLGRGRWEVLPVHVVVTWLASAMCGGAADGAVQIYNRFARMLADFDVYEMMQIIQDVVRDARKESLLDDLGPHEDVSGGGGGASQAVSTGRGVGV